jgi:RNA polymerase sigma-70 factor, ECF subfamily
VTELQETQALDDRALIVSAQQGDRHAFNELVCRHQAGIVGMLYHMCGDAHLAEDAAQEAFLRVWQILKSYKPEYAFRSWLYRIAANIAVDILRREKPAADVTQLELAAPQPGPEQTAETNQRTRMVREAIARLSTPLRLVLVLREYQQLSYQEIAAVLELPTGTVMSRLNSARSQLRKELSFLSEEL